MDGIKLLIRKLLIGKSHIEKPLTLETLLIPIPYFHMNENYL